MPNLTLLDRSWLASKQMTHGCAIPPFVEANDTWLRNPPRCLPRLSADVPPRKCALRSPRRERARQAPSQRKERIRTAAAGSLGPRALPRADRAVQSGPLQAVEGDGVQGCSGYDRDGVAGLPVCGADILGAFFALFADGVTGAPLGRLGSVIYCKRL